MACEVRTKPTDSKTELARNESPRSASLTRPLAKKKALPFIVDEVAWKVSAWNMWSCRLSPTGRSASVVMPCCLQVVGVPDPREHQELRGADEPGGEHDLLAGADDAARAVLVLHLDAGGAAVVDDDLGDHHLGLQLERRHVLVVDVAARGAVAQAAGGVLLHPADALLRLPVVVVEDLDAEGVGGRLDEVEGALLRRLVAGDLDRAAGAAVRVGAVLEVLHALVRRVDLVGGPAGVALGRPGVVVGAVAAHVDHAVDGAGAADDLAPRDRHLAVEQVLLRRGVVAPVDARLDLRHRVHRADHPGLLHQELLVALAGLEQDHALAREGEPSGEGGACAARAHDDVVGLVAPGSGLGHASPLARSGRGGAHTRAITVTRSSLLVQVSTARIEGVKILSVQSSVAYGHVGNSAAVFPLQRLGHEVWPVLTVHFSNHTGYGAWRGPLLDPADVARGDRRDRRPRRAGPGRRGAVRLPGRPGGRRGHPGRGGEGEGREPGRRLLLRPGDGRRGARDVRQARHPGVPARLRRTAWPTS